MAEEAREETGVIEVDGWAIVILADTIPKSGSIEEYSASLPDIGDHDKIRVRYGKWCEATKKLNSLDHQIGICPSCGNECEIRWPQGEHSDEYTPYSGCTWGCESNVCAYFYGKGRHDMYAWWALYRKRLLEKFYYTQMKRAHSQE